MRHPIAGATDVHDRFRQSGRAALRRVLRRPQARVEDAELRGRLLQGLDRRKGHRHAVARESPPRAPPARQGAGCRRFPVRGANLASIRRGGRCSRRWASNRYRANRGRRGSTAPAREQSGSPAPARSRPREIPARRSARDVRRGCSAEVGARWSSRWERIRAMPHDATPGKGARQPHAANYRAHSWLSALTPSPRLIGCSKNARP